MADIYVPEEAQLIIAEQSTFGTTVSDSSTDPPWHLIQCSGGKITPDVTRLKTPADRGQNHEDIKDRFHTDDLAMPLVSIPAHPVRYTQLSRWFQMFFHNCTEGIADPFDKVFALPTSNVDFASNEGLFCSVAWKMPEASSSYKIDDCIAKHINLKISPGSPLSIAVDLVGRGSMGVNANPTATLSQASQQYYEWGLMARDLTYNVGSAVTPVPVSLEVDLAWDIMKVGSDGTGNFQNFILKKFTGKVTAEMVWDSDTRSLFTQQANKTALTGSFGFGTGVAAGDSLGDLLFEFYGTIDEASLERGDSLNQKIVVDLCSNTGTSVVPITITMADGEDKEY
jgi:hypothetical protein